MGRAKKKSFSYEYPRPAVTVDVVVVTREDRPRVLLIQRKADPFASLWALPGGFVNESEPIAVAARRELLEETGMTLIDLEQLHTFGDPGRDPRGWTISVAFLARIEPDDAKAKAGDDAADAQWFPIDALPGLAFDHDRILERAKVRMRDRSV